MTTVYLLDKPLTEAWTQKEIDYIDEEYGVEIERLFAMPFRAVALSAPVGRWKPIYMTWRAACTIFECEYKDRWVADGFFGEHVRRFDGLAGHLITELIGRMIELARERLGTVVAELNGIEVSVKDGDTVEKCWAWMQAEQDRKYKEYVASPEYKERCRLAEEKATKDNADRAAAFAYAPEHMSLRDPAAWQQNVEANTDSYGGGVIRYAEKWARLMEFWMSNGMTISECADRASHLADDEGITGFMYGCAVSILSQVWEHGEALRLWHNKKTQIGSEGDKANESGGVLNPALLSIG